MGYFYFDESIQERGNFIIGAFVYSGNDITPKVYSAIEQVGLRPKIDEFKSGARMDCNPEQAELRGRLSEILSNTRIGVIVTSASERASLGEEALLGLRKILFANGLEKEQHSIFLDQSIVINSNICKTILAESAALCKIHPQQDSKIIGGIQLADLAAHSLGGMLLEHLGLITKTVRAGENSGYEPNLEIELGFELWASLRYQLFKAPQPNPGEILDDPVGTLIFDVKNYGLHISESCSQTLKNAALGRFGDCYLGCIH